MEALIFQKGWNYSQDGPGNRLLYHFQGCNLKCPWCSNPEGISGRGTLLVDKKHLLPSVCPKNAIKNNGLARKVCVHCTEKTCLHSNRNLGIKLSSRSYPIQDLVAEVTAAKPLFHSGGGVTLTGGEPTLQFECVRQLLTELKNKDINTAIETNGTHPSLKELFPLLDTLIIDCKHCDDTIHKNVLGLSNSIILSNITRAASEHPRVWLRIPLIPDFNSSPEDMEKIVAFVTALKQENLCVELLPYHEYGKVKWEQCGMAYVERTGGLDSGIRDLFEEKLKQKGVRTIRT